ncbi:SIR2 family NAD-dependent protein deacylase [Thermomonospora catenispora]|uniref:SIR2 family NAD-dependent protein deacylase n=1 Tax=Thermomonospora catenispora TaxID=2493090 RepID=UPI001120F4EA|nr:Sir2 family NAD-dependent protein deacetylase [Thermomonospora catenispora]TNY37393.1 NAD-dependent deacetylase [Thermomonospora catenispora]
MDLPDSLAAWLPQARSITVLTGAGISTDSSIPDFRGPQGVWTKDPAAAALSSIDAYLSDPAVRRRSWQARLNHPGLTARPNAGHAALVELERTGRLRAVVTQNIDGLHQAAGSSPDLVIEIHGTMHEAECLACGARTPMRRVLRRVEQGEEDPLCLECGGIQKSATISFGQALKPDVLEAAVRAARECDLFLAVGTSLTVHPAAGLCPEAVEHGARLVIVNAEPTPYDPLADAVVREPISDSLPRLVRAIAGAPIDGAS